MWQQLDSDAVVKKYNKYRSYNEFLIDYRQLSRAKSEQVKNSENKIKRLNFDLSFNPNKIEKWKFDMFKNHWENLEKGWSGSREGLPRPPHHTTSVSA
jgi:hypothetical protein